MRTLKIRTPTGHGSSFTIERHGKQWLVTARHVVDGVDLADIVVEKQDGTEWAGLQSVPTYDLGADISVFHLGSDKVTPDDLPLTPSQQGVAMSQDVYFLGFPYDLNLQIRGEIYPFVKKAIVSSQIRVGPTLIWALDGINNPGFSGGPVVFKQGATNNWHVLGVISGYRTDPVAVQGAAGWISINTGIILSYSIKHATESIDAFVGVKF